MKKTRILVMWVTPLEYDWSDNGEECPAPIIDIDICQRHTVEDDE